MADFVAVIRRTVDGLSENTPEMRDKVYEKARAAVRRQLENMNPRPSDDMINRQLAKLENAIGEVDSEYAEALPAVDEVEPEAEVVDAVVPAEAEPEPGEVVETPVEQVESEAESEPVTAAAEEPATEAVGDVEPADADSSVEHDEQLYAEPVPAEATAEHAEAVEEQAEPTWQPPVEDEQPVEAQAHDEEIVAPAQPAAEEVYDHAPVAPAIEPEPESVQDATWDAPAVAPAPETSARSEWELPDWEDTKPAPERSSLDAKPDNVVDDAGAPELLGMHPVEEKPAEIEPAAPKADASRSWSFDDDDPFASITERPAQKASDAEISDWSWPVEKTSPTPAANSAETASQQERAGTAWDHIDDLLGLEGGATTAASAAAGTATAKDADRGIEMPARPTSYRTTPKPSRFSVKRLVIVAGLLLVLGGGGFAYWQNREAGNAWISGMVASITSAVSSNGETPAEQQSTPPAQTGETATQQPGGHDDTAVPDNTSTKFTQRLLADGSETDAGPAVLNGESAAQEGKSVAPQTEAGKPQEEAAGTPGTDAGTPGTGLQPGAQPAQPDVAVANGEKMFLYEERLGQSSPTAIPGTVAWSVKEESPGGDAKPEPAIQAQITVPDRGLTALMTIKRNADPSLPASHVIEFVFSLPQNFEGGAIDGVQRVSMKRTEQDRGDALIAVPAKITDDFHMIALNDFAEAVGSNTELLRSRGWIDIPLTYRNGRRALLTLEKGQSGNEAFSQAMRAWGSSGNTAATGQ
ncbi:MULTISPECIES: hypothetical protein [unclassified Ensifer]|uniref:hypothetical protein n=1 Tax=unclassified Ensifer TaxID=2633371 RepID=UPI00070E6681|nr:MULTISPECIES: hypothetical protein [unclassified Ensifer]KQW59954.1 hypothetical protein ASD03_14640 [Ensifer sp. Root127]MBD9491238.1 hypothetical protein [Ensifer sp. ENS11]MDP9631197.1 hypothetical protein [Ensifer adhaerens]PSS61214.1 hypothetical protein C6558_29395 [Ensifer sp. NM-2]